MLLSVLEFHQICQIAIRQYGSRTIPPVGILTLPRSFFVILTQLYCCSGLLSRGIFFVRIKAEVTKNGPMDNEGK